MIGTAGRTRPYTGAEYLESLRDGREIYIYGERVTDVALGCGYESTSAFINAFRQQFNATPGEFFR